MKVKNVLSCEFGIRVWIPGLLLGHEYMYGYLFILSFMDSYLPLLSNSKTVPAF